MALISVIKYDGKPDVFAWKYPDEAIGVLSQLVVNQTQIAILLKGGEVVEVYGPGTHTLTSNNIPILENIVNLPFGGDSPFKVEVWFVNRVFNLDIKWGTPSPIQLQDPTFGLLVPVKANGTFGMQIEDPVAFLTKLVGTLPSFTKADITDYFRGLYITRVKDAISTYIVEEKINVLEINTQLDELSETLRERVAPIMQEYGVGLTNFYVNDIAVPLDDPGVVKLREALARRADMDIVGYNYVQERSFDTLEAAAKNEGSESASLMGAGVGLGMGMGLGGGLGTTMSNLAGVMNLNGSSRGACPQCHFPLAENHRFCPQCGAECTPVSSGSIQKADFKYCSSCGNQIDAAHAFCPSCGKKTSE